MFARCLAVLGFMLALAAPASAAQCGGDFNVFIAGMSREAQAQGVSPQVAGEALAGLTPSAEVLAFEPVRLVA